MDEEGLEYPEDDLDQMLDDELEIMRDLEKDQNKENEPARRSLEFGNSGGGDSFSRIKPSESNVGIGKRARSSSPEFDGFESFENSISSPNPYLGTKRSKDTSSKESTPTNKRLKTSDVLSQFSQSQTPCSYKVPILGERKVYRRIPDTDYLAITHSSGERYYVRMISEEPSLEKNLGTSLQPVGLCGVPFHELQEQAGKELKSNLPPEEDTTVDSGIESGDEEIQTQLWVEKFKPRSYLDLLSDDGTNRILLLWLKLWDKLVFNRERAKKEPKKVDETFQFKSFLPEVLEELDEAGRPKQKVALLHGPPGLGKTTLAHIVALHAGYKVVEMNASDDRSIDAFKKILESSTQMRSVLSQDQRPNCLIIDEIDGAPPATINYLVSVLTGQQKGKKKNKEMLVLRPIICICNDLYTPALRPLKQLALVIPFPPTSSNRLAGRLREIARKETMKTDLTALLALCKKTDNDIRSCLSTLQFFKRRGKVLSSADIAGVAVGVKDSQKSLFSVWDEIFTIPSSNDTSYKRKDNKDPSNTPANRYKSVFSAIASCGESDRIISGVFENYLNVKFKDSELNNVVKGGEWFTHFDILHQEMMHSQNYSIMGHLHFPILAAHFLFSSVSKTKLSFPTQNTEFRNRLTQSNNVLESVKGEMSPKTRVYCSRSTLVRDLLPTLLSVIQPVFRPVTTQLYSSKEKAELANLVSIHIAYNITYQQHRNMEGQYEYKMDPDVESVANFPGVKRVVNLTYGSKQLIAHEIELEKMRRVDVVNARIAAENKASAKLNAKSAQSSTPTRSKHPSGKPSERGRRGSGTPGSTPVGSKTTTSHLAKLTPKQINIKERKATDFFGRVIEISETQKKKESISDEIVKTDVWFRFKEGFSNAVRRNVKMKDLL